MTRHWGGAVLVALLAIASCGTSSSSDAGSDARSDAAKDAASDGLDCSKIGCAMNPGCGQVCSEPCGCCGCPYKALCGVCPDAAVDGAPDAPADGAADAKSD